MSLSFQPIEPVLVRDPRMCLEDKRYYAVLKAGSQTTMKPFTTTSISSSSMSFSCPPASAGVVIDRKVFLYLPCRLTFTALVQPNQFVFKTLYDAPRAFPISSSIDTLSCTINNQSMSINIADIVQALMHYNTDTDTKNLDYSMSPAYQDQYQTYSQGIGSIKSPLATYADNNDQVNCPRGGFPYTIIANPQNTTANPAVFTGIIDVAFCEPLFLSPLMFGQGNSCGLYNVSSMDFNITYVGNLANRMWSHDDTFSVFQSSSCVFGGVANGPTTPFIGGLQPQMLFTYITPQETQLVSPQKPLTYSYFDTNRFPTDFAQVPSGVESIYNSNNIQLNSIPRRMYIFMREKNNDLYSNASKSDVFFQISNVSLQWGNKNGLLASATPQQLYQMCVKNHCKQSFTQWSGGPVVSGVVNVGPVGTQGSIICLEFATDIGCDSFDAPGVLGQYQLQVQIRAKNMSPNAINPTLYIVPIMEGTFTVQSLGQASTNIGVITHKDILDCQAKPWLNYADIERVNGGNFWDGIKNFFSKANTWLKDNKVISTVLDAFPATKLIAPVARNFGYGEEVGEGILIGGKRMSKRALHQRIKDY